MRLRNAAHTSGALALIDTSYVRMWAVSGSARAEWLTGIMAATVVQFEATKEGTYTVEHVVDEASLSLPIHIVHGGPPGASAE
jgi:glycine cleavage system aminomethyltransferase T